MTLSEFGRIFISVFGLVGIGFGAGKLRLVTPALGWFVFAVKFNTGEAGASSGITLTSVFGIVSLIAWLNLLATG